MSDKSPKNRRLFLKSAAAMGLAGVSAKAAAQDVRPVARQAIRDRVVAQVRGGNISQSRNTARISRRLGADGISNQAAALLRNDSLVPADEVEATIALVREMAAGLDSDFTGVMRVDLAFGVDGDPRLFNCGSNTCGGHTCGTHTCGTNNCGSQTCGTNNCTSNVSITAGDQTGMSRANRQQWQVMQQMQREMQNRYLELNVIRID